MPTNPADGVGAVQVEVCGHAGGVITTSGQHVRRLTGIPDWTLAALETGIVGLGHMDGAMAARLLAADIPCPGRTERAGGAAPLLSTGLCRRDTPRAVAEDDGWFGPHVVGEVLGDRAERGVRAT
jgi:hypothetical protein